MKLLDKLFGEPAPPRLSDGEDEAEKDQRVSKELAAHDDSKSHLVRAIEATRPSPADSLRTARERGISP